MNTSIKPSTKNINNTEPTLQGAAARAWLVDGPATIERGIFDPNDPRIPNSLPLWVVHAPNAHPVWSCYIIACVALAPVPGLPDAKIYMPGATHEVFVAALDPDLIPELDGIPQMLRPLNFAGQFIEVSNDAAATRVQQAVQDVVDGALNPDTDFCHDWVTRFSGSNLKPDVGPDFIAIQPGVSTTVVGTGSSNVKAIQEILRTQQTLKADENKPQ
jgi:hypothetical protein